jgi:multidrug efflux system outer membrane protein
MRALAIASAVVVVAAGLTGCVVGPNYAGPAKVPAAGGAAFRRADDRTSPAAPAQGFWWVALGDPELDRLETAALAASPDLELAAAKVREARAVLSQNRANGLPTTGASTLALHSKGLTSLFGASAPGEPAPGATNVFSAVADATWELDLFGANRRAVEGAAAQAQAYQDDLQGAKVSLAAEVAQAYLALRDYQARLSQTHQDADIETELLRLTQERLAGGTASELDVERLNDQLQATRADFEPLAAQITDQLDRLAVLTARAPGDLDAELTAPVAVPSPPANVAVGDPGELLRRRPDIRAAERRLAQQNALIGQRIADYFPKVELLGDIGFAAPTIGQLFNPASELYAIAPIIQWTPFDFGRTHAKVGQARAARDEAEATYRKAVLTALEDAENALSRYGRERQAVIAFQRVQASADRAWELTRLKADGGGATSLDVLQAERARVQAATNLEEAQAQLTEDFVVLQKALGLGWQEASAGPSSAGG